MNLKNKYSTNTNINLYVRMLMSLAFVKSDNIEIAFEAIEQTAPEELSLLFRWFKKNYIIKRFPTKFWSTYGLNRKNMPRTTNSAESWDKKINNLLRKSKTGFSQIVKFLKVRYLFHLCLSVHEYAVSFASIT